MWCDHFSWRCSRHLLAKEERFTWWTCPAEKWPRFLESCLRVTSNPPWDDKQNYATITFFGKHPGPPARISSNQVQIKHAKTFSIKNFGALRPPPPPPKFFMFAPFPVFWKERRPQPEEFAGSGAPLRVSGRGVFLVKFFMFTTPHNLLNRFSVDFPQEERIY